MVLKLFVSSIQKSRVALNTALLIAALLVVPSLATALGDFGLWSPSRLTSLFISLLSLVMISLAILYSAHCIASPGSSVALASRRAMGALPAMLIYTLLLSIVNALAFAVQGLLLEYLTGPLIKILPFASGTSIRLASFLLTIFSLLPLLICFLRLFLVPLLLTKPDMDLRSALLVSYQKTNRRSWTLALLLIFPLVLLAVLLRNLIGFLPELLDIEAARTAMTVLGGGLRLLAASLAIIYWSATMVSVSDLDRASRVKTRP